MFDGSLQVASRTETLKQEIIYLKGSVDKLRNEHTATLKSAEDRAHAMRADLNDKLEKARSAAAAARMEAAGIKAAADAQIADAEKRIHVAEARAHAAEMQAEKQQKMDAMRIATLEASLQELRVMHADLIAEHSSTTATLSQCQADLAETSTAATEQRARAETAETELAAVSDEALRLRAERASLHSKLEATSSELENTKVRRAQSKRFPNWHKIALRA